MDPQKITVDFTVPLGDGSTLIRDTRGQWYHRETGRWLAEDICRPVSGFYAHHLMAGVYPVSADPVRLPNSATASGTIGG